MTWFDMVLVVLVLAVVVWEARMETGRALLDTMAALAAVQFARVLAVPVTTWGNWRPLPGTEFSPLALALSFGGLLIVGLTLSKFLHQRARWSMDQFDLLFGAALGVVIAVAVGHGITEIAARFAIQKHGYLPEFWTNSLVADELRSFRTYHLVVDTFHNYQNGRGMP
ncbi:MAG: hypothetical protein K0Q72_1344 [Armatimonadetes bacterium]|jgi:hypothetical protein|nr:hypothetical protein [Armatimonadota bacterium]